VPTIGLVSGPVALRVGTADGLGLEAELAAAGDEWGGAVLCHPHPQFGGTMRSIVIGALFEALPATGMTCLRFNFRGVEGSDGRFDEGRGEREDARAAVGTLAARLGPSAPLVLVGWSFGADVALSVREPRLAGWVAVAPPLRFVDGDAGVGADGRPKLVALAEHDEFRAPADAQAVVSAWAATEVAVVGGASHFFVGRTDALVAVVRRFMDRLRPVAATGAG
jgi:uncharacterized protein